MKNLLKLDLNPTQIAFSLYVIREYFSGPLEEINFDLREEKFAARKTKWVCAFYADVNQLEFWIIYKDDEALGMAWRIILDGVVKDKGLINYELNPYSKSVAHQAINDLPIIKRKCH